MSNFLSKVNPFYKFVFIIVFATVLTFWHTFWVNVVVFAVCMLLLFLGAGFAQFLKALKFMIPITFIAFSLFMSGVHFGADTTSEFGSLTFESTQNGLNMAVRVYAFAGLGLLVALTTDSYELVKSMQKDGKMPRKFAYGMLAAVNLLPQIKDEYLKARLAFMVRGERVSIFSIKPVFSMLVNCFQWSETLSIAMFSKGFHEE